MKNLFKMTMVLVAASLTLTGCDCFKKMAKDPDAVKVAAVPEVLVLNNGKVAVDIKAEIPAKYFNKTASLKVTPVLSYADGIVAGESLLLQGEKVASNGMLVKNGESLSINRHVEFDYKPELQLCELQLLVEVKCKSGKCKEYTLVNANTGALPTKEEAEVLAKGGAEAPGFSLLVPRFTPGPLDPSAGTVPAFADADILPRASGGLSPELLRVPAVADEGAALPIRGCSWLRDGAVPAVPGAGAL